MTSSVAFPALGLALLAAAGCSGGGGGVTGGSGGSTSSSSSSASSTSSTTTSSSSSSSSGTGGGAPVEPSGFACSGATPSLTNDVVPITAASCSTAACHLAMQSGSGVHDQLVNRVAEECADLRLMVAPGDPEHSYVIHKLSNHNLCNPATTMPLNQTMLSAKDIQTIYDWICEGAPSN